jgi:micrococcal nuclease
LRRSRFQPRRPLATGVVLALVALVGLRIWQLTSQPGHEIDGRRERVKHVIDGDTLELADGSRVRLIGVDTPETKFSRRSDGKDQPLARDALEFAEQAVEGREVRLEFDFEREDKYGRLLAYVWYTDGAGGEALLLNEQLIRAGLASALLRFPYSETMKRRFRAAESDAKRSKRGLWADLVVPE